MTSMFGQVKTENLPTYLGNIERIFPEFSSSHVATESDIQRYYTESFWGYSLFHSWAGAMHMALSPQGTFSKNDYFRQVEEIAQGCDSSAAGAGDLLEIGCGKGFNVRYLADRFPQRRVVGIDLTARNVLAAKKATRNSPNVTIFRDDFYDLSNVATGSVAVAFAVEVLCHASEPERALNAARRVLAPGGRLIVYDGFRSESAQSKQMEKAMHYAERAMAVPRFQTMQAFARAAESQGFRVCEVEDRSEEILPNLIRLSDLAKGFFRLGFLRSLLFVAVPRGLVANSVAGLLLAVTVRSGAHRYQKIVLERT